MEKPVVLLPQPDSPDDPDALPLVDLEGDPVDRHDGGRAHAELRPEALNLQHRRHGPHTTAPRADITGAAPGQSGFSSPTANPSLQGNDAT